MLTNDWFAKISICAVNNLDVIRRRPSKFQTSNDSTNRNSIHCKLFQNCNCKHELHAWIKISCDVWCDIYLCFNQFNCIRLRFYSKLISILMFSLMIYMYICKKISKFIHKLMWLQRISLKNSWSLNNLLWWNGDIYHVILLGKKFQTINGL